jgi:tRNA (guanosine-2'-O-)-methyltransferase
LKGPAGVEVPEACTPTGPEKCFNAIDDNCNGIIDEGCATPTGLLQFVAAWGDSHSDVDLTLTTPTGERIGSCSGCTRASHGFHYEHDCPKDEACAGQNTEDIWFEGPEPPPGPYKVELKLNDAQNPVHVIFGARLGPRTVSFEVDLQSDAEEKTFGFDLP